MSMISKALWNTYHKRWLGVIVIAEEDHQLKCSRSHKTQSCVAVVVVKVKTWYLVLVALVLAFSLLGLGVGGCQISG